MTPDALETLRQMNDNLRSALIHLRPERKLCSSIRPQDFSDLLSTILRAAECLRHQRAHAESSVAFEKESFEFRRNLENLKDFLPDLHGRLLAEKSRLETAQTHVAAAAAWTQASKRIL